MNNCRLHLLWPAAYIFALFGFFYFPTDVCFDLPLFMHR